MCKTAWKPAQVHMWTVRVQRCGRGVKKEKRREMFPINN